MGSVERLPTSLIKRYANFQEERGARLLLNNPLVSR